MPGIEPGTYCTASENFTSVPHYSYVTKPREKLQFETGYCIRWIPRVARFIDPRAWVLRYQMIDQQEACEIAIWRERKC